MRGGGFTYRVAATPYVNKKPGDCPVRSVNIPLIAPRLAQFVEIIGGGVRVHAALAGDGGAGPLDQSGVVSEVVHEADDVRQLGEGREGGSAVRAVTVATRITVTIVPTGS